MSQEFESESEFPEIRQSQASRRAADLWRERLTIGSAQSKEVVIDGKSFLNFSSNDYLGLANHAAIRSAATLSIERWGLGSGASHLVCGHQQPHAELEHAIAEFVGAESALLFSTGYMANLGVPQTFLGRDDLLLQDKLNHASLIDASLLCRAKLLRYRHLNIDHARDFLNNNPDKKTLVATDGVFSMNGNVANVVELMKAINNRAGNTKWLLVDDAHGFGVLGTHGRGTLDEANLKPVGNILLVGTLSKAAGAFGAFVAGDRILTEQIIQKARPFIYTTALPPLIAVAASKAIELFRSESWRQEKVIENLQHFRKATSTENVSVLDSRTPIQSVVFGKPAAAIEAAKVLRDNSILAIAIRPPTVPAGTSRLRITLTAEHNTREIDRLVNVLASPQIRELQI